MMRRRVLDTDAQSPSSSTPSLPFTPAYALKTMDMFPKVSKDFTTATPTSTRTTTIFFALLTALLLTETRTFLSLRTTPCETVTVGQSLSNDITSHGLRINLNITFPALSCSDVHLDAMDVAGDNQVRASERTLLGDWEE